jgi:hypothetical protein
VADILIDLDRPDPRPREERDRPRWSGPTPFQWRVLLVVAALLVTTFGLGAAVAPRPPRFGGPVRIPGTGADEFLLADDLIAVNSGRDQRIYAYGLDGSLKWAASMPVPRANLITMNSEVILLTSPMWPGQTAALDRATGALRWGVDGLFQAFTGDTVIVGVGPAGPDGAEQEIVANVAIDASTGREKWRENAGLSAPRRTVIMYDQHYRATGRISVAADGTGEILDYRTGRKRSISGIPVPPAPPEPLQVNTRDGVVLVNRVQAALSAGDLLIVFPLSQLPGEPSAADGEYGEIATYGPDSAGPLWTIPAGGGWPAGTCGPWICVVEADATRVLDPATGEELRRIGWPHVISGSAERFLGYDDAGTADTTQVTVFDARSGRVLADYVGWLLLNREFADWIPMVRRSRGLSWDLATVNMATGIAYPLGTFDAAGERACQSTLTHTACTIRSGETMIWRHAPSR